MAFDNLHPQSREWILALAGNMAAGTHGAEIIRYSGTVTDPRARIVQKGVAGNPDHTIMLEGYGAGESLQRLIAKGFVTGGWIDADTWEGRIADSAVTELQAG